MFNFFKNLPNCTKILLLIFSIIVAAVIISQNIYQETSTSNTNIPTTAKPTTSTNYKQVSLTVKNLQKEPLDNVKVEFHFKGPPSSKFTDSNGYVQIEIPERDKIKVYLSKEGYQDKNYTLNLLVDPNTNIEIELQKNPSSKSQLPSQELELGGLDLKQVCKDQYPNNDAKPIQIKLMNESFWKCQVNINMEKACNKKYPGSVAHIDQAGSWKCYRKVITTPQSSY